MSRSITVDHEGVEYEAQVMKITKTRLGAEDHGIWTFGIELNGSGYGVTAGGYPLLNAHGMQLIKEIVDTVDVGSWEQLAGQRVLALFPKDDGLIAGLAHIEDQNRVLIFKSTVQRLAAEAGQS